MPYIDLHSAGGPGRFYYNISTPTESSAKSVDKALPTVILLHPVYIASQVFHPQLADPQLRRFNLVTLDLRGHGETSAKVRGTYGQEEAAQDVIKLMDDLDLPASHIMGLSMGACIALQMAILFPDRVLSLFMASSIPLKEPQEVAEGRQEIYDCWEEGFRDPENVNVTAISDAIIGSLQLAYNNTETSLTTSLASGAQGQAMRNWSTDFDTFHTVTVKFFTNRDPHPVSSLSRVRCPITLIHCSADVAYPIEYCNELLELMKSAQLDVNVQVIDGAPHFGSVTHPKEMNALLFEFVMRHSGGMDVPPAQAVVVSPFYEDLVKHGLLKHDSDSESD
ncbi:Alpha/Beta hydrolase protein [Mycena sp. CBHHK59/15]|nr:Alpha/Beta hydrolase protein [Mycena sp. CBHHK59/15]